MVSSLDALQPLRSATRRIAAAMLVILLLPACSDCSLTPSEGASDEPSAPWPLSSPVAAPIPESARAVLFVREFEDLERGIEFALERLPSRDDSAMFSTISTLHEVVHPEPFGFAPDAEVAAFYQSGQIGFVVPLDSPKTFEQKLESLDRDRRVAIRDLDGADLREAQFAGSSTVLQFTVRGGHVLARTAPRNPPSGPSGPIDPREAFDAFFAEQKPGASGSTWPRESSRRTFFETVVTNGERPRAVGFTEPGPWLEEIEADGQAAIIQSRLAHQLGPTGFRIHTDDSHDQLRVDIRSRPVSGEPTVVSQMGEASGRRPALGGLVEPGVLGMLRLSVDPKQVYRALESTLPAEGREQLDVFWRHVRRELLIDGPDAILENLTGHAAVVFYGLEGDQISGSGPEVLRRIFELRATREVVLLPIESHEKAERLLDKLTQITRGRLSRQRAEHTVQYIWLRDGSLQWALILGDEYVMFVDSATSLRKATQYERRGRRLSKSKIESMRLGPVLEGRQRSGLYLDTGTLAELLRDNGRGRIAEFLGPFRSLAVTTEMDGEASRTRLRLDLETQ